MPSPSQVSARAARRRAAGGERKQDGQRHPFPVQFVAFSPRPRGTSPGALPGSDRASAANGGRSKRLTPL